MHWLIGLDGTQVILSGMTTPEMLRDKVKTFSEYQPLSEEEEDLVKKVAQMIHDKTALLCTGCRYCVPNCPIGLEIPELLRSYNEMRVEEGDASWRLQGMLGMPEEARPTACVRCGACTEHCSQQLDIPAAMKEMGEILKNML